MTKSKTFFTKFVSNFESKVHQTKLMRLIEWPRVIELVRTAKKIGLFRDPSETNSSFFKAGPTFTLNDNDLYCFVGGDEKITERVTMKTYYIYHKNVCIVSQRDGENYITRIRIKDPGTSWCISKNTPDGGVDFFHESKYLEVYSWWNVDWLGFNKPNLDSAYITGVWNTMLYNEVKSIFDIVQSKTTPYVFNDTYKKWFGKE